LTHEEYSPQTLEGEYIGKKFIKRKDKALPCEAGRGPKWINRKAMWSKVILSFYPRILLNLYAN
jgi:hypothetical protein